MTDRSRTLSVAIGADHGGFEAKRELVSHLAAKGLRVVDLGASDAEPSDYPVFGFRVGEAVGRGRCDLGILLCRSGAGMAIAANKVRGVRAAVASDPNMAALVRRHNAANVLVLGADFLEVPATSVVDAFLAAEPEGGRHARRVALLDDHDRAQGSAHPSLQLRACGQSVWLDDISDMLIASGELRRLVEREGVRGVTSNPAIFEKAINSGEGRYGGELVALGREGISPGDAYERLTMADIAAAADVLRPVYDATGGDDGFVSYEVLPGHAYEEDGTFEEAVRLFRELGRPNVMIKIPATPPGVRAFRRATAAGVNVNVTLIFSRSCYEDVARAYVAGLEDRLARGEDVTRIRSVASVFVSRIDTVVDKKLVELRAGASDPDRVARIDGCLHRAAIDNARLLYGDFRALFHGDAFEVLARAGAAPQRPLWASTGVKDPSMRDTIYVEELVAPDTVNTIPGATLRALFDHGRIRPDAIGEDLEGAVRRMADLEALGIDLERVCLDLQTAGVKLFADAFDKLFEAIRTGLGGR